MGYIKTTFTPDGKVVREAIGFEGGACLKATLPYEQAAGGSYDRDFKPEMAAGDAMRVAESPQRVKS